MAEYFDICGTHIPISTIKDFRTIKVEFVIHPGGDICRSGSVIHLLQKSDDDRHQAFVLTSEKEESYPVVLYVYL